MAEAFVVSDASTLIGLASSDGFEFLDGLFGQVAISEAGRDGGLAARVLEDWPVRSGTVPVGVVEAA